MNYTSMRKLSSNIKHMYKASAGYRFILVVASEVTNYLMTIPLYRGTSHEIEDTFINYVFCKHVPPCYVIFDENKAFFIKNNAIYL